MKKGLIILFSILALLIVIAVITIKGFSKQFDALLKDIDVQFGTMETLALTEIPDGVYEYRYGSIPVFAELRVHVKDHRIEQIEMLNQSSGPGYDALETIDRILAAQQPKVDVVSGATSSSKVIMIATYKALKQE
ncbi:MAG: FMN-binding protein [Candidatus Marinimicrobia bacterium]|nr:FMN-binding protein [Candidatus Neomarinimicrobiota bacterium]